MNYYAKGLIEDQPNQRVVAFSGNMNKRIIHTYPGIDSLEAWSDLASDHAFVDEEGDKIPWRILQACIQESENTYYQHSEQFTQ